MQLIADMWMVLPTGHRTLEGFVSACEDYAEGHHPSFGILDVCMPNGHATDSGDINSSRCFGCLACVESDDKLNHLSMATVPTNLPLVHNVSVNSVAEGCFQGSYIKFNRSNSLAEHSQTSETMITNPLATVLLWQLSANPSMTPFACSPSGELSVPKAGVTSDREGHLDITIASTPRRLLLVMEGKKSSDGLVSDAPREQLAQYGPTISEIAGEANYKSAICYLVGGSEEAMYPQDSGVSYSSKHSLFMRTVDKADAKFVSLEALRALKAWKLSVDSNWTWEEWLFPLLLKSEFIGIVTGGTIMRRNGDWVLEKAPWA